MGGTIAVMRVAIAVVGCVIAAMAGLRTAVAEMETAVAGIGTSVTAMYGTNVMIGRRRDGLIMGRPRNRSHKGRVHVQYVGMMMMWRSHGLIMGRTR